MCALCSSACGGRGRPPWKTLPFLGRVVVGYGFTSDGRNDGGDGVLRRSIDGSGITRHQQGPQPPVPPVASLSVSQSLFPDPLWSPGHANIVQLRICPASLQKKNLSCFSLATTSFKNSFRKYC